MKDYNRLIDMAKADLDSVDIPYFDGRIDFTVNTRATTRWGQCRRHRDENGNRMFTISLNYALLRDDVTDQAALDTIAHELIHTCSGCMNHGVTWKSYAERLDMFGYSVKRCTSTQEKGIAADTIAHYKYAITCKSCGWVNKYQKAGKVITRMQAGYTGYVCGRCKSPLTKSCIQYL